MTFEVTVVSIDEGGKLKQFCRDNELQMERLDACTINVFGIPDDFCDEFKDFFEGARLSHKLV